MASHTVPWTTLVSLAFFRVVSAQNLTSRGCAGNDSLPSPLGLSYEILNASGTYDVEGFYNIYNFTSIPTWTWGTGIQSKNVSGVTRYEQPVWLDTHGTDLAADDLSFNMCYLVLTGQSQSQQKKGQNDDGDCTTFFSEQCVKDLSSSLLRSTLDSYGNATSLPCKLAVNIWPESCEKFSSTSHHYGEIPPENQTCEFGQGDPDYDLVTSISNVYTAATSGVSYTKFYDEMVTRTLPIITFVWAKDQTWADARAICLKTDNITAGSREADGVPSSANALLTSKASVVVTLVLSIMTWFS
ncbi:hypothetical protein UCRPC4_g05899 [Phaeomoniella chlamydospora]|uniref:Uncharacterized protein n=1 Tax=Phaeomoniella chlamydospora TaxID=158046 RepID=A0A0G2E0F3_PHACM|nr:hypothetical protein UCRPC4_g05899 [Phaeomoniella chlamydospora]